MTEATITDARQAPRRPLALVTGASSGIGRELARELAERGYDLVVSAEDDGLEPVAAQLRTTDGGEAGPVTVTTVRADLRTRSGVDELWSAVGRSGHPLDVAALNAGLGRGGAFVDTDIDDEQAIIDVNVTSTVRLAKHVLRDMVGRHEGRVLVTSSIASQMPGTYQAVYNASKSFLQSFAQAVGAELDGTGVEITSLMPGPTETNFFHRADMDDTKVGSSDKDDPAQVARQGIDALLKGRSKVVAGSMSTRAQSAMSDVLPDSVKAKMHAGMAEPGSAPDQDER